MVFGSHFIFDGTDSRDYNLFLCSFDGAQEENLSMGLGIEAITMELRDNTIDYGGKYNEVLIFQFSACLGDKQENKAFDRKQVREIVNWLSSKELKWLSFYDEDDMEYWYFCRFTNIETKKLCGRVIGFSFEVTCDSPYAYSDIKTVKLFQKKIKKPLQINPSYIYIDRLGTKNFFSDTDVSICPIIFIEQHGFSSFKEHVSMIVTNNTKDNIYKFEIRNFSTNDSIENDIDNRYIMFDIDNWVLCNYKKENVQMIPNYETFYKKNKIYNLSSTDNSKLLELEKGMNSIDMRFAMVYDDISTENFIEGEISAYIQYREKYKVGVF